MPTYEYECKTCGHQFEALQRITAEPLERCPRSECPEGSGRGRVRRLIGTGGGLLFKGSGFYITDYRSDNYKKAAKADTPDSKPASSKSGEGGKGDSAKKPASSKSEDS